MSSLDPSTKLYRETPCEHDLIESHKQASDGMWCPGGSREEVTIDYEAAAATIRLSNLDSRQMARAAVDAALKSAGFTKKFASGESSTE